MSDVRTPIVGRPKDAGRPKCYVKQRERHAMSVRCEQVPYVRRGSGVRQVGRPKAVRSPSRMKRPTDQWGSESDCRVGRPTDFGRLICQTSETRWKSVNICRSTDHLNLFLRHGCRTSDIGRTSETVKCQTSEMSGRDICELTICVVLIENDLSKS